MDDILRQVLKKIQDRHPHEPEFHQAVTEVVESLGDFLKENPQYTQDNLLERLIEPERTIIFRVARVDDQGNTQVNSGYRVQFSSILGPYKGGLRFHPTVSLSILKFLGFEQIFKNALTGLSLGGGKGGSDFDPKGKSDHEIMRFCQAFMSELSKYIGPDTDIPAGDIGVGSREIGYLFGMYKKLRNEFTGVLTGKGITYGGSLIRTEATGYGIIYFLQEVVDAHHDTLKNKKILVSGSGNVAQYAIQKAMQLGAKVVSASDSDGTIELPEGFTPELFEEFLELKNDRRGRLAEREGKQGVIYHAHQNPRSLKGDIALPCATQNEVNLDDARKLINNGLSYLVEGANMPTTLEATRYLIDHGIVFAPGKAANAGGVATSGLEMSQNSMRLSRTREQVDEKLHEIMKSVHTTCVTYGTDPATKKIDYITGANIGGFVKVAEAMLAQGIV